jgi:hypothetical protein
MLPDDVESVGQGKANARIPDGVSLLAGMLGQR